MGQDEMNRSSMRFGFADESLSGSSAEGKQRVPESVSRIGCRAFSAARVFAVAFGFFFLLGVAGAWVPRAHAQSASTWAKRGQAAEEKDDFDTAYDDYLKAYQKKPGDLRYKTHYERMRFQAAAFHVENGRKFRKAGRFTDALAEDLRALNIDPSNEAAQQEINETRRQMATQNDAQLAAQAANGQLPAGGSGENPAPADSLKELNSFAGPVRLKPVSDAPITMSMVGDTKDIYRAVGKLAGLNVLFDPDYTSKRIPIDLTSVPLSDALRIIATVSGTFWKPVTSNTIFVAQNTTTKRRDLEQLAVQTFYLTNAAAQDDANQILTALRNMLDPSVKVFLVASQSAIVMRATPDQLLLAQKLIDDLDRARPEVVVDVAVLEVNRDKLRNIGIQLPQNFGVQLQSASQAAGTTTGTTTIDPTTGLPTTTNTGAGLSLNDLAHLNATNFAVTVGAATANLLLTDSDTRILQNPRIRASDNQKASLKIGSKIPVATGSFGGGVGGVGAVGVSPIVQTQFTYLDVGVNIDMTPTVHYDHDVTLKLKIEVSSENGISNIGGISEPIISQKIIDQVIRLKEGEVNILAGILQKTDTVSVTGTPGLGEIPLIKYLFSSQQHEIATDEVVFMLTPHIVREAVLSPLNLRQIDTGSGTEIELRREPSVQAAVAEAQKGMQPANINASAQGVAGGAVYPPMGQAPAAQVPTAQNPNALPPVPQTSPSAAANAAAAQMQQAAAAGPPLSMSLLPSVSSQTVGSTFTMTVQATGARDLAAVPMEVQFNPKVLSLQNVDTGDLLSKDHQAVALVHRDDGNGNLVLNESRPPGVPGVNGDGSLCVLTFKVLAPGSTTVALTKVGAKNSMQANYPAIGSQATINAK